MSINKVVISGRLTRNGELRVTANGLAVLSMGVAVNDRRKNVQTGEWEDYANFIDCVMFGARAQALADYLVKGIKVVIEGRLHWSQWEHDDEKRNRIEVIVDDIDFASARSQQGQGGAAPMPQAVGTVPPTAEMLYGESEIPF